jgi:feruloyl esterase
MLPAHCRIDDILERRTGVDGVEYGIRFALALPDEWSGQFLFQGGGGLKGSFFADQEATLNFLYAANAKVTVAAKEIVARYYRRPAAHSYFVGCSTGGREAMIMSQRFPRHFDGLVAGAPAMRTRYSNLGMRHVSVALGAAASATRTAR